MNRRMLLAAGLIPLPWFLVWSLVGGALAPGYSAISQHASELTLRPGLPHTLLNVAAIGSGVGFAVFAIGLWLEVDRRLAVGALCWLIFGISMISNGIWPMGSPLHGLYALGLSNLIAPPLSLLELPRLRNNRFAYGLTAFVSVAAIVYLWLNLNGLDPPSYRGLTQRIFSSINSLWPVVVAVLLLSQPGSPAPDAKIRS
jgi:Protein of unknown function (DUF998)